MTSTLIRARDLQPGDVIRSNVAPHIGDGTPRRVTSVRVFPYANAVGEGAELHLIGARWTTEHVGADYRFILVSRAA